MQLMLGSVPEDMNGAIKPTIITTDLMLLATHALQFSIIQIKSLDIHLIFKWARCNLRIVNHTRYGWLIFERQYG